MKADPRRVLAALEHLANTGVGSFKAPLVSFTTLAQGAAGDGDVFASALAALREHADPDDNFGDGVRRTILALRKAVAS